MTTASELPSLRLDATREEALERTTAIVAGAWRSFDRARPGQPDLDRRLHTLLRAALPEQGSSVLAALDDAAQLLDESIAQPRPRFFAFVGSSGLEVGVLGDLLASCFDVNLAVWAGAASEVEDQAVRWVSEFIGYPAAAGAFTSGGTISNVTALAAARERALPGARRKGMAGAHAALYCSEEAHYSVVRAAELLGIGSDRVRSLPIDSRRRLRPAAVADAVDADRRAGVTPVAVVATAGTTLTGSVDPIDEVAEVCAERGVWLHVDGAYGVAAASTPSAGALFSGLDRADSVTLDAHKWLFLPKACGVVLVHRHQGPPRRARTRGGLHPPRTAWPPHGRHHPRVLAAVPRPEALARLPCARRRRDPRGRRAEPGPGATSLRRGQQAGRARAPLRRAAALDRPLPARSRRRRGR